MSTAALECNISDVGYGRERPILFSTSMVRALIAGRKTMTRRIMKLQPAARPELTDEASADDVWGVYNGADLAYTLRCPYGQPGDLLWVRETWALVPQSAYRCSDGVEQVNKPGCNHDAAVFRAGWDRSAPNRWRPSIHMPRWASRLTLCVTEVKVERLQDISEADAEAEGVDPVLVPPDGGSAPHVEGFRLLWNSINGAGAWDANPWVWAVRFEVMKGGAT